MNLRQTFKDQAAACATLGSPFMGHLLVILAENLTDDTAIGARILKWPGDASNRTDAVALRLAGALHALVLQGKSAELSAAYPPNSVSDAQLWQAVQSAFANHEAQIQSWLNSAPQTNEVRRSAALIPAFLGVQHHFDLPLHLLEMGASAGLNLQCDMFALHLNGQDFGKPNSSVQLQPEWAGPLPQRRQLAITGKAGCDLNPLNPAKHALTLNAYIWPDQAARLARTQAAIEIACQHPVEIEKSDAAGWLTRQLDSPHTGAVKTVYHTVAWQYFPQETKDICTAALYNAGARATTAAPLAWVRMEADGKGDGAGLRATTWPGGHEHDLGRADFHGRWVRWNGFDPVAG